MALECSTIQNLFLTRCILLPHVTSVIRFRLLFCIPWQYINIQYFMGRTLTALGNCFESSKSSKFENQTQQIPVLQMKFTLSQTFHFRTMHPVTTRYNYSNHNLSEPKNVDELHHFLRLTGYYRKFILLFVDIIKPLYKLLRKVTWFQWSTQCQSAFEHLKNALCKKPILQYPDMTWHDHFN